MEKKSDQIEKIKSDRLSLGQEIGYLFRPLALCPFPAQTLGKRKVIDSKGNEDFEHNILWERRSGNIKVEIVAHPKYGVPFGQDILLVLYLAIEARRQKSRKIKVNFYRDFMRMFRMNPNDGRKYQLVKDSLNRIKESKYSWKTFGNAPESERQKGLYFLYIDDLDLNCNPKNPDQLPLFEQYILLSERFWFEINTHPIPFNLEAIRFLKTKPAYLNFYIWLTARIGMLYSEMKEKELEKGEIFIPYWGEYGLINQLSTRISRRPNFRNMVGKWLQTTKEIYPKCPVLIDGDGLKIQLTSPAQLDVQINPAIEIGKYIRRKAQERKDNQKPCPSCKNPLEIYEGKEFGAEKLPDFYRCKDCKKNYYQKDYPELYKETPGAVVATLT